LAKSVCYLNYKGHHDQILDSGNKIHTAHFCIPSQLQGIAWEASGAANAKRSIATSSPVFSWSAYLGYVHFGYFD
jgi:hypothetical protein